MTDRKEALTELLAKVEAGDMPDTGVDRFTAIPKRGGGVYADPNWYDANGAYWRGDLNAAKALHEAVLPGWDARLLLSGSVWVYIDNREEFITSFLAFSFDSPARAWLIAILKALIARAALGRGA